MPEELVAPRTDLAAIFESPMSKKEWILRAGLWTLRAASRPFVTGSWRRRLVFALVAASGVGGGAYAARQAYQKQWGSSTEADASQEPSLATLEPRNGSQREADPLRIDGDGIDDPQLLSNSRQPPRSAQASRGDSPGGRRTPFAPDSDSGTHRNPAASDSTANRNVHPNADGGGRMRFGGISSRPIRPASDEQPTDPESDHRGEFAQQSDEETTSEPNEQVVPPLRGETGGRTSRGRWSDRFASHATTADESAPNSQTGNAEDTTVGTDPADVETDNSEENSTDVNDESDPSAAGAKDSASNTEPNRLNTNDLVPPTSNDRDPPSADSMRSLRDLPRGNASPPALNERRRDARQEDPAPAGNSASTRDRQSGTSLEASTTLASESPGARQMDGLQTPSLAIEKTVPPEVQVGRPATVQLKVRNLGKVTAYDVVVHDMLPAGMQLQEMQPNIEPGPQGSLEWVIGTMNPGAEASLVMKLIPRVEGELGSVAQISFRTPASMRTVSTRPQVGVQVDFPSSIMIGETATATITISNSGSGAASNLFLDAVLPDGMAHPAGRELQSPLGNLMPGAKKTISLPLKAVKAGPQTLAFSATNETNVSVEESMAVEVIAPDLEIRLQGPKTRFLDRQGSYVIALNNPGTAPAEDIELILFLSKGMKYVSANNRGEYDRQSHAVYWNLARLPAGEQGEAQVTLLPTEMGQQKVRAEARAARSLRQTDERQIQVEGFPELQFSVSDTEDPIDVGGETTYEVLITNKGSQAASNIELSVDFPAELEPQRGTGPVAVRVAGSQAVSDPIPQLVPGEKAVFKVTARGVRGGDSRVRVQIVSDDLRNPVTKEERTVVHDDER